ncbi:hypothetical protein XHC_4466, partial [Xanthomonas hortorum pv. carotae str. M081]
MQIRPDNVLSHRGYGPDSSDYGLPYQNSGNDAVSGAQQQMNGFLYDLYVSGEDQKHMNNAGIGPQQNENSRQPSPSAGSEQQL